jgi:hypothetical protein
MSRIAKGALAGAALLLAFLAPFTSAISRSDFDRVVDFTITLKTVAAAAAGEAPLPSNRLFILDGTVSDISFVDKEKASFRVRILLMSGEWIGLEDVKSYACYVTFSGPEFFALFPARPPRDAPPGIVVLNSHLLVVARPVEVTSSPQGEKLMMLEGFSVRVLP